MDEELNIIKNDPWLEPYKDAITGRHQHAIDKEKELTGKKTLADFATGHLYFGLHHTEKDGLFASGLPMLLLSTLSVISTAGRNNPSSN